jgi:branched-chain amino acid transport system ATP-binding protein
MSTELLRIARLAGGYGDLQVLWDIDLCVQPGEYVAVLGSNGAGKSTLLKTIAGVLRSMTGSIVFDGTDVTALKAAARVRQGISLVPEGKRLFSGLTVKENLMMGAFSRTNPTEIQRGFESVLELFPPLRVKLGQIAGTLSGGEQQMCSVGRALMGKPRLLLVDELSFGLSPMLADRLFSTLSKINEEGTTIVLVEQDVVAALRYAHRAYVIAGGRIVREGPSEELARDPMIKKSYLGG